MDKRTQKIRHFLSVARLYLGKTPQVRLILFMIFASGIGQVVSSTIVVPIVSVFTKESSLSDSAQISGYVKQALNLVGMKMSIPNLLFAMIALEVFSYLLVYVQDRLVNHSCAVFVLNVRRDLLNDLLNAKWKCLVNHSSGETTSRLTVETQRASASAFALLDAIVAAGYILVFLSAFLFLYWQSAALLCFITGLSFYLTRGLQYKTQRLGNDQTEENNSFINQIIEFLRGIKLIKVSALEDYANNTLNTSSQRNQKNIKDMSDYQAKMSFYVSSFRSLTTAAIIFLALVVFRIQISMLVLFFYLYLKIMPKINLLQIRILSYFSTCNSLEGIEEFRSRLSFEESMGKGKKIFERLGEGIVFKNVSFSYGEHRILENINIKILPKMSVGIAGPSGAGKSTLVDLLVGLHKHQSGDITLDSTGLFDYKIRTWREKVGYVTQDDIMFNDTIWNNLVFGLKSVDKEWVDHCVRLANMHQFIGEAPDGYDTVIGESGIRLSGGQRQRLSLARALIRKPELLILDEATSSLDTESERIIQSSIRDISHKMTILMIAHRLSTLADADIIYVLDNGICIEEGTYAELVQKGGYFSRMYNLQTTGVE